MGILSLCIRLKISDLGKSLKIGSTSPLSRVGNGGDSPPGRSVSYFDCFFEDMGRNVGVHFFFKIFFLRRSLLFISFLMSQLHLSLSHEILEK